MHDLERLVAIEDIRSLQSRYVRLADSKDWSGVASLFLPRASFTAHDVAGEPRTILAGPREIAAGVAAG